MANAATSIPDYTMATAPDFAGRELGTSALAVKNSGSWWPHWLEWITARSGGTRPSPALLGSPELPVLGDAHGRYVLEN
jgi:hypothetical protein